MARVSVIIPCYNHGRYLGEAVASVLAQTYDDYEIIIVNDGSTDPETNTLLASWDSPKTRVIQTDNQGLAAARNNGIREAGGEYILPLDADDRIGERYLAAAVKVLDAENEVGIVYCRARLFGAQDTDWNLPEFSLQEMLVDNVIFCSAVFRRTDWEETGGYDESLVHGWEDYDFWLSLLEMGRKVHRIPETLFYYRVSADSMVRARPRQHKLETFAGIFRKHQSLFADNIEAWIDKLLDAGERYYQARLLTPGSSSEDDSALVRKVDVSTRRLEFRLPSDGRNGRFEFLPADDAVILRITSVVLEVDDALKHEVAFTPMADFEQDGVCIFCSRRPVVQLILPEQLGPDSEKRRLVIELEYLALGPDCLHLLPSLLQSREDSKASEETVPTPVRWTDVNAALLKRQLKSWRYFLRNSHYRTLKQSGLFDAAYYLQQDRNIPPLLMDPLIHYVESGWREGRNPNPLFEANWYRKMYRVPGDRDPLLHYVEKGGGEGDNPNPLFWSKWYTRKYPESATGGKTPLAHYIHKGWRKGCNPNPLFESLFYAQQYPDTTDSALSPLAHYLLHGLRQRIARDSFFDVDYYLEDNPSVVRMSIPPLLHYVQFGADEGRSPNRFFDPGFYRATYDLDELSMVDLFVHFVEQGSREKHRPSPLFDPEFYAETYPESMTNTSHPLRHYQEQGVFMGNYPCREVADLAEKPVISILTPVYNTDEHLLRRCIHSVLYQAYPHWELCLVDDGSSKEHVRKVLEEYADLDSRIKVRSMEENKGISAASNEAAAMATGEYVGFLDHDDELTLDGLYEIAGAINDRDPDVLYTDEDLVNLESRYQETFYKPDYNPVLLQCHNYITHFLVTRRALFEAVGGFSDEYSGAQDYDLFLKLVEKSKKTIHLPRVVYHWRAHETSTSINHSQKQYADEAGRKALAAALKRRGLGGTAEKTGLKFFYRVDHDFSMGPKISIICTGAGDSAGTDASVRSIVQSTEYENFEIILPEAHAEIIASLGENAGEDRNLRLVEWSGNMSEPAWTNRAAEEAEGEYLVFLDPALTLQDKDWLTALLAYAHREETGLAGGRIDYPQSDIQHTGTVPDISRNSWYYYVSFVRDVSVHLNGMHCPQNVQYVPETLCMIRRDRFLDVGGFSAQFSLAPFAGLDLCQRLSERGFMHVYTPYCRARADNAPLEHGIAMTDTDAAAREKSLFQEKWHARLVAGDPFYNRMVLADKSISLDDFLSWYAGLPGTG